MWDEENSKWWFSANDIVRAINEEEDYNKARNYWKYLKGKMAKEGIQLVSVTNQFKFQVPDGKQRAADALDAEAVQMLAQNYPNNRANAFLNWFIYSDNTIDGQSKKKAYTLAESGLLDSMKPGTVECLQQIHAYLFGGLYDFADKIRTKTIAKGNTLFCLAEHLHSYLKTVEQMPETTFDQIVDKYVEMNAAHPFMEGNGRSTRIWLDMIFAVLDNINNKPGIKSLGLSDATGIPKKTIDRYLSELKKANIIRYEGSDKSGGFHINNDFMD